MTNWKLTREPGVLRLDVFFASGGRGGMDFETSLERTSIESAKWVFVNQAGAFADLEAIDQAFDAAAEKLGVPAPPRAATMGYPTRSPIPHPHTGENVFAERAAETA